MIATKRNGQLPNNTSRKPKIKREEATASAWIQCAGCGCTFFSDGERVHCHTCRPDMAIVLHECLEIGCREQIPVEENFCLAHAPGGQRSEVRGQDFKSEPGAEVLNSNLGAPPGPLTSFTVPIGQIEPDPDQPRKEFDETELAKLARSLKDDGQLVPLIVTENREARIENISIPPVRYRIIGGERRWRAAQLAGLTELRVEVRDLNREDVLRLQGMENLLRKDLNPIEEARWCRRMCQPAAEGGGGLTQQQLADRLGVTQAEIANRIRVLRAPKWALDLVISGQMSRKHATALLQFEGAHRVLGAIENAVKRDLKKGQELEPAERFTNEIRCIARNKTEQLDGREWDNGRIEYAIDLDALAPAQREALELIEVPDWNGKKELRAQNEKLAQKLLNEAKRAAIAKREKKGKKQAAGSRQQAVELTPAEKKRREKERAEQPRKRLSEWYHDWLRVLVAKVLNSKLSPLNSPRHSLDGVGWLALWAMLEQPESQYEAPRRFAMLAGAKPRASFNGHTHEVLAGLKPSQADEAMRKWTIGLLIDEQGHARRHGGGFAVVPDEVVTTLAGLLSIDVAAAWRDDRSSPLRERYWNLHDKEGLLELGKELKVPLAEGKTKAAMVAILLGQQKPLAMPKEVAGLGKKKGGRDARSGK